MFNKAQQCCSVEEADRRLTVNAKLQYRMEKYPHGKIVGIFLFILLNDYRPGN